MGYKRKARIYALQALYMYEIADASIEEIISLNWIPKRSPEEIRQFAIYLIKGSINKLEYIDSLLNRYSKNWRFERISAVDKSILRMSIYSLLFLKDIPISVTINEGIELGKLYGGENSGKFINGILEAIKIGELNDKEDTNS
ncbi:MAG: transcription antitermination factor NusB [Spirochaetota bacterium]|nr:transcription antitermination factor NusB [Spirochaetota bacterium]